MSYLDLPQLIECRNAEVWARHPGFSASPGDIRSVLEAIRAQGFKRLCWPDGKNCTDFHSLNGTPFQALQPACPPRDRLRMGVQALTLVRGNLSELRVGVGFLRYVDRWYFSVDGENFQRSLSSATVWRDNSRLGSSNER